MGSFSKQIAWQAAVVSVATAVLVGMVMTGYEAGRAYGAALTVVFGLGFLIALGLQSATAASAILVGTVGMWCSDIEGISSAIRDDNWFGVAFVAGALALGIGMGILAAREEGHHSVRWFLLAACIELVTLAVAFRSVMVYDSTLAALVLATIGFVVLQRLSARLERSSGAERAPCEGPEGVSSMRVPSDSSDGG